MGLIVHQGKVEHTDSFDNIEEYGAKHRTRVRTVELWGFERLPIGQICVRWANGAIGSFVAGNLSDLHQYVAGLQGWPTPKLFPTTLPHSAGRLWLTDSSENSHKQQEKVKEEGHAVRHIVRERVGETRRRRTRSGNAV